MTVVTVSETYDLSTKTNKMSLVAVHTPSKALIKKTYPGLAVNHRFFKFLKCDIKVACASVLPADPLQVGVSAGKVAPQDLFNPILYKACTTESLSNLEARILGLGSGGDPSLVGESVRVERDHTTELTDDFGVYYSLLANRDGFKVAHPQAGLEMKGLVPLVYEKLYQFGVNESHAENLADTTNVLISDPEDDNAIKVYSRPNNAIRGKARPMPRMNTLYLTSEPAYADYGFPADLSLKTNMDDMPDIPACYVAMLILPPSKLNVLYYRMICRWYIEFSDVRPISDIAEFSAQGWLGSGTYFSDYNTLSKSMDATQELVDVKDADITKIMEGR